MLSFGRRETHCHTAVGWTAHIIIIIVNCWRTSDDGIRLWASDFRQDSARNARGPHRVGDDQ